MARDPRFDIPKYQRPKFMRDEAFGNKKQGIEGWLTPAQKTKMRTYHDIPLVRQFGSAGYQPVRNQAFQTKRSFDAWKTRHPKSPWDYQETDIDGDEVPDAVVWSDTSHRNPIAVNGWGVKGSKARVYMNQDYHVVGEDGNPIYKDGAAVLTNYWDASARARDRYQKLYYTGPDTIKETWKIFLSKVVKKFYDELKPKTDPANAEFRKQFPASRFHAKVAKILVGDVLDRELGPISGYPNTPAGLAMLHRTGIYKTEFNRRLLNQKETPEARQTLLEVMNAVQADLAARDQAMFYATPEPGAEEAVVGEDGIARFS
jgi:hypothetical protein